MFAQVWLAFTFAGISLFHLVFIPAAIFKKNDFADILWGPVFPLSATAALCWKSHLTGANPFDARSLLVFLLVSMWAIRLAYHVGKRNLQVPLREDPRYNGWRKNWGEHQILWSYLKVYLLQSVIMLLIGAPIVWVIAYSSEGMDVYAYAGLALWLLGFLFEAVGDQQLKNFMRQPANRGKLMTTGLWSWTRHPNYFGEATQWWGLFLFALPLPFGWITVISPLMITFLLLKVSGVPLLEEIMEKRAGWDEYKKRVSIFLPLPPRRIG